MNGASLTFPPLHFCYAQADNSLTQIRYLHRMLQGLHNQNFKHPSSVQQSITCTKGLFKSFQAKIHHTTSQYHHSYQAMLALDPSQQFSPGWMQHFQKLEDADILGPGHDSDSMSEGTFQPSWIWLVPQLTDHASNGPTPATNSLPHPNTTTADPAAPTSDSEVTELMYINWARCQAQANWYKEEVALTIEEMGRTLHYFEWKKALWMSLQFT